MLAIEALGKLQDKAATPKLAPLLSSPSPRVRGAVAVAFWRLADSAAVAPLVEHLPERTPPCAGGSCTRSRRPFRPRGSCPR
ncbi:MAG: HEAT repeat domain-containing protein [Candidatus Eisenbacteria bacterium]|nr:HEAT repeat domain-containing protein [Candidatus Eisenbacteria bacterium]